MLTKPQVQRYAAESSLRDIMIAEKEIVLTFLLQLLAERGPLKRLAFKGGTCLRKIFIGSQGRFSTDLDFTGTEEHDHEDVILDMMGAFAEPFHGIQFSIPDKSYYEADDGVSWGVNPVYIHDWNKSGESEIKFQVSRRETPTLLTERRAQIKQSYFASLPFPPTDIHCLALPEVLAEKIRACYQRNKARDVYDLAIFATRPLNQPLIRRLVVLKLWQVRDAFDPRRFAAKLKDGKAFDWDDLAQLTRHGHPPNKETMITDCVKGYAFLSALTDQEFALVKDSHQRERELYAALKASCLDLVQSA
ncbi:MAG: nucleotidyl transferase AbiEii/AbiGii toxin family protein [Alphaproteobacteria bacterium]|nr:MAG: nucleotidyl transferase AbiEii/AbiGii toxin family protein [Alphaproteobacteria bacterium]